jgi:hypothetical protein
MNQLDYQQRMYYINNEVQHFSTAVYMTPGTSPFRARGKIADNVGDLQSVLRLEKAKSPRIEIARSPASDCESLP